MAVLGKLFLVFFKIGFFAVGGAYSFLPLVKKEVVQKYGWMTASEFLDITGMTTVFPGAISIKYSTYIGYKVAGIPGVVIANLGNMLPPIILITAAGLLYKKYSQSPVLKGSFKMIEIAVFAMIVAVAFQLIGIKNLASAKTVIFAVFFGALFFWGKFHPAYIIIGAGVLGAFVN